MHGYAGRTGRYGTWHGVPGVWWDQGLYRDIEQCPSVQALDQAQGPAVPVVLNLVQDQGHGLRWTTAAALHERWSI